MEYQSISNYGDFVFNDCKVCMNPIKVGEVKWGKGCRAFIKFAEVDGKIVYGYEYSEMDGNGGACCPCMNKDPFFATMEDAIYDLWKHIKQYRNNHIYMHEMCRKALAEVKQGREPKQLTLF